MSENEVITYYSENPPNNFALEKYSIKYKEESRVCGDNIEVFLKIENDKIEDFSFIWETSIITKASASIFGESIIGLELVEILKLNIDYIIELVGKLSSRRKYWAILGLLATHNAIHEYLKDGKKEDYSDVLE